MNLTKLHNFSLPNPVEEIQQTSSLRKQYVIASANITFALEEASIEHSRDVSAAMVTASTHDLELDCTVEEYLDNAIQSIAYVEENLSAENSHIKSELTRTREILQEIER